jgi:hypothetical protein
MKTNRFLSAAVLAAISMLVACSTNDTETTTIGQSSSGKGTEIVLPGKSSSSSSTPNYVFSSSSKAKEVEVEPSSSSEIWGNPFDQSSSSVESSSSNEQSSSSHISSSSHSSSSEQSSSSHSSSSQNSSSSVSSSSAAVEDPFAGWQVVTHNAFIDDWMTNERIDTTTAYSRDGKIPTDGSDMKVASPRDIGGSFTFSPAKVAGGGLCTGLPNTGVFSFEQRVPGEYTFVRVYLDPSDSACERD